MADRHQLPRPVMGRGARFDPDQAWPYRLEEAQHLTSSQLPPHDDRAVCGDTVNLENSLRQIEPDDSNGLHDTAPRRDVPDDDTARTAGQVEVVHTITSRLEKPAYDPTTIKLDEEFVMKKLGMDEDEFARAVNTPLRRHDDYPNTRRLNALKEWAKRVTGIRGTL